MNRNFAIIIAVIAGFTAIRILGSPPFEAVASSALFAIALFVALRLAGGGNVRAALRWFADHRATSVSLVIALVAVSILALYQGGRSALQLVGDVLLAAVWFWAFASIGTTVQSRWLR